MPTKSSMPHYRLINGDCIEEVGKLDAESIDYSVFSPPFESIYSYSDSPQDLSNCRNSDEFFQHLGYLIPELFRVTRAGRCLSFHCMNLPSGKAKDGFIGLKDFRGKLIAAFQAAGWIFHSEVCIWKDPVTAMQRTKAIGLLYKQLKKDSCLSRQGIPDYLVTMRKPGDNAKRVSKIPEWSHIHPYGMKVDEWQEYASPVWMDIQPNKTLQSMREEKDSRHICPLQIEVIERAVRLWSSPGDIVLSPFAGIGSEGYVALKLGRQFVGVELKKSYYEQGLLNLKRAESEANELNLWDIKSPLIEAAQIEDTEE